VFVGHIALSLASKKATAGRTTSLVWFVLAANFVDLIWPLFLIAGIETVRVDPGNTAFTPFAFDSYPWSHSLLMGVVWGAVLGGIARWRGVESRAAGLIGALVVSHWVLDLITHRPDLTLWPGATAAFGLGLWNSIPGTFVVEGILWVTAIALYLNARRARGAQGHAALWSFLLVNTVLWVSGPFSPPPPDGRSLAYFALIGWVVVPWAWWIERTSEPRS